MSLLIFHSGNVPLTENGMKTKVFEIKNTSAATGFQCITEEPDIINMVDELLAGTIDWVQLRMYDVMHNNLAISKKIYTDVLPAMRVDHFNKSVILYMGATNFTGYDSSKTLISITLWNTSPACTFLTRINPQQ